MKDADNRGGGITFLKNRALKMTFKNIYEEIFFRQLIFLIKICK